MRARIALPLLAALSACAGPSEPRAERTLQSPAAAAIPESDPALRWAPQGPHGIQPVEQVAVRVRRGAEGRVTIVEFVSPGLQEAERIRLRAAFEAGELRIAGEGTAGEESWVTTLLKAGAR